MLIGVLAIAVVSISWSWVVRGDYKFLLETVRHLTLDKTTTSSGEERLYADVHALNLLLESGGLGVGWGSNRPSSFAAYVLSNTGVVGFGLLVWFSIRCWQIKKRISLIVPNTWLDGLTRSLMLSLAWILTAALISVPDMTYLYWWLLIGLLFSIGNMPQRTLLSIRQDKQGKECLYDSC